MTSLMSIFDPSLSGASQSGWYVISLTLLTFKLGFWSSSTPTLWVLYSLKQTLLELFENQKVMLVTLFLFILCMNIMGLLPLVFSPTSHLSFNLSISMSLWLGMMLWYIWNNMGQLLSHLTPVGAPLVLAPVLVIIELISNLIRPMTLSLRLMANVMAGHMILLLISEGVFNMSWVASCSTFVILVMFFLFEVGVAFIQTYVFTSLMALYWEESSSSH